MSKSHRRAAHWIKQYPRQSENRQLADAQCISQATAGSNGARTSRRWRILIFATPRYDRTDARAPAPTSIYRRVGKAPPAPSPDRRPEIRFRARVPGELRLRVRLDGSAERRPRRALASAPPSFARTAPGRSLSLRPSGCMCRANSRNARTLEGVEGAADQAG